MPPRPAAVSAGPPSALKQQARELHAQHKREDAVIRKVLRLARAARRSTPRPREGGARMVASGRDGTGERDDGSGSGSSDGEGGGSGDGPGGRSGARHDVAGGAS